MAARIWYSLACICLMASLLVGCQAQSSTVSAITPPSFDSAVISTPDPTYRPTTPRMLPGSTNSAALPAGWMPPVKSRPWKWIVVHHSATAIGGAKRIDQWHREKGWDELGYHFVIGNGTDTGDGAIEVGGRWSKQKWGAHAKTPDNRFNDYGIGICLVGNFDTRKPSPQQLKQCAKLISYLMKTYRIPASNVVGHRDTKATECPGRYVSLPEIRRQATQMLAEAGDAPISEPALATTGDLLHDVSK